MDFLKMFKSVEKENEENNELDERMKQHYEAFIIAKETYYSSEELKHDLDYQNAREMLGYPRTDNDINFYDKKR